MIVTSTQIQHNILKEMVVMSHIVGKEESVSTAKSSREWKTQRHATEETEAEGFSSFRWSFSVSKKNCLPKSLIQATGNFLLDNNTSSAGKYKKEKEEKKKNFHVQQLEVKMYIYYSKLWSVHMTPKWFGACLKGDKLWKTVQ